MPPDRRERAIAIAGTALCAVAVLGAAARVADPQPIDAALAALPASRPVADRPATGSAPAPRPTGVALSITLWARGPGHAARTWRSTCPPRTAACTAALAQAITLRAGEVRTACHAGAGGMGEAMVLGTVRGRPVDAWLDQRDPCDAAAWARLRALLRPPRAGASHTRASP